jgi:hypothetical protein
MMHQQGSFQHQYSNYPMMQDSMSQQHFMLQQGVSQQSMTALHSPHQSVSSQYFSHSSADIKSKPDPFAAFNPVKKK